MATVLRKGPTDHGLPMSLEEFLAADYEEGYQYELIDGELYVSPEPNAPQGIIDGWINNKIRDYARAHPEVINWVYHKCRVFVPGRRRTTCPEPDGSAYHDFPLEQPIRSVRWQDVSPVLVVEVLSLDDPDKDLVRNVELYLQVPTIQEYWILDTRADPDQPSMIVRVRYGKKWRRPLELRYGDTYTTKLLPGFSLTIDPRK